MDSDSSPEREGQGKTKRRPWPLAIALGVIAAALPIALVTTLLATDDHDEDARRSGHRSTSTSDEPTGTTVDAPNGTTPATEPANTTTSESTTELPSADVIADGISTVDQDVAPGRYITTGIRGDACSWARLADPASDTVIAAESNVANQAIVDILDTDAAFRSNGCGAWSHYRAPDTLLTTIDQGDWVIGEQIEPGAYLVPQAATCTWTRATGFEHTPNEITQTEQTNIALEGPYLVTLAPGERFTTKGCAAWTVAS